MAIQSSMRTRAFCLLLAAAGAAQAQSATTTRAANTLQPVTAPTQPAQVPSQLGQRPAAPTIPTRGPASPAIPQGVPAMAPMVYDRQGRLLPGLQPAGPNRVLDTRTGRYYDAVPAGDGMRIVR